MINRGSELPPIPDKLYFTIGEVAKLCDVEPHVLRYWEQVFSELKPTKRNERRVYRSEDVSMARKIRELLYQKGFTISGAKQQLRIEKLNASTQLPPSNPVSKEASPRIVNEMIVELKSLIANLKR